MKKIIFVHCCYQEHLEWLLPLIDEFLLRGFCCHLYPTHWDPNLKEILSLRIKDSNFKLLLPRNKYLFSLKLLRNRILQKLPVLKNIKSIAIQSYISPGQRFLKKNERLRRGHYDNRVFDLVRFNARYCYNALIAHGIHANVISNFSWQYFTCPKWIVDRGALRGSVMLDKFSTEDDNSELQKARRSSRKLSAASEELLQRINIPLVFGQNNRNGQIPDQGKNLLYPLSRIQNEVNLNGCLQGLTELAIVRALASNLPPRWNLIVKIRGKYKLLLDNKVLPENVYLAAGNTDINYLLEKSDAVISFISKIGLQAAAQDKAVITMGAAHYSHQGFTRDLGQVEQLKSFLLKGPLTETEKKNRDSFFEYYLQQYLIFPDRKCNQKLQDVIACIFRNNN